MNDEQEKRIQADLAKLFDEVKRIPLEPDPYLSVRVLSSLRARKQERSVPRYWKWIGIGGSALASGMMAFFIVWFLRNPHYEAFVERPFVVKMEVTDLRNASIAKAEIRLPEGVYFDIDEYPELKQKRSLTLVWHNRDQKEFIPFVLTGHEEGTKTITVLFYNDAGQVVGEKRLDVRLTKSGEKS